LEEPHQGSILNASISEDNKYLQSTGSDGRCHIYENDEEFTFKG